MSVSNNVSLDKEDINDDVDDKLVTNIKGHHRLVTKVDGIKKFIDVYTTKYTPGSKIRCAVSGHIYNDFKVGSCNEDLFLKVCLAGFLPETSKTHGKFLYYSHPADYEQHFDTVLDDDIKNRWNTKSIIREQQILEEKEERQHGLRIR